MLHHNPVLSQSFLLSAFIQKFFFSGVINLLLTKVDHHHTWRILTLGLFCMDLTALYLYCQDLGLINILPVQFSSLVVKMYMYCYWCSMCNIHDVGKVYYCKSKYTNLLCVSIVT